MMFKQNACMKLPSFIVVLTLCVVPVSVRSDDGQDSAERQALKHYEAAVAAGRHAEATKTILDYMEMSEGENAPLTVALTQRYGNLLRVEGNLREGIAVLKAARQRGIVAYGEHGIELFAINMDLGEAYVDRDIGFRKPKKYFDDALEVLRENGQHETILYVTSLVGIASRLTQAGALNGALSFDNAGVNIGGPGETLLISGLSSVTQAYGSGYGVLEAYLQEAVELAELLDIEDPYLSAKVAIVQAKTKVLETVYLEVVPASIRGSVSGATVREKQQQADNELSSAIDVLMADAEQNQDYIDIANGARLDIAWLSEDMERMTGFCTSNTLNMASQYPPDRLYEIEDDGSVIAPRFSFRVSSNLFRRMKASNIGGRGPDLRETDRKPQFVPVCIDGRLMAVLINSPKVTIEEID